METCGILPSRKDVQLYSRETCPCLRPQGHSGAHLLYIEEYDQYIVWETDWNCDCKTPDDCEGDWCILNGEVSSEEAAKLIASGEYEENE